MGILRPMFNTLSVVGCWTPPSWSSSAYKRTAYKSYTIFVLLVVHIFSFSQFLEIILNVETADELSESIYMFIATTMCCCKIITLLANNRNIKALTGQLREAPCRPMDEVEAKIQNKFDKDIGSIMIRYIILVETTVACMIVSSLFTDFGSKRLAYRAWLPYDYSSSNLYYLAYGHQIVGLIACSLLNVACDCVVCGLVVHTCSQLEILKHRLKKITPETTEDLQKCVRHHNYIYRYALIINEKFKISIGVQFVSSTLVVCFNLYQLSHTPLFSSKYLEFVLYMACMMTQIFFYCWYGNQLKLKSMEIVYGVFEMDWVNLDNSTKKSLTMLMRRAMTPIEFTSAYVLAMDLNTFVGIIKLAYSVYNLLERTKE